LPANGLHQTNNAICIIERNLLKTTAPPGTGKFTIPLMKYYLICAIVQGLCRGSLNFQRTIHTDCNYGFDEDHLPASSITVVTDSGDAL